MGEAGGGHNFRARPIAVDALASEATGLALAGPTTVPPTALPQNVAQNFTHISHKQS